MREVNTILVVDDDRNMRDTLSDILKAKGYKIIEASNGREALEKIYDNVPHLVILDVMLPEIGGKEVCRILKEDAVFRHLPVIMLTVMEKTQDKVEGIDAGADDYIAKPFDPAELVARVGMILRRTYYELDANPLTRFPGNRSSVTTIEHVLHRGRPFAICYIDIDNIKAFNDKYGFERGDSAIRFTADIILEAVRQAGTPDDFIGHLGGDDFLFVTTPERVDKIANSIIEKFDAKVQNLYDEEDIRRGCIVQRDRTGNLKKYPIMSISIVCVHNEARKIHHIAEVSRIAAELKKHAKSFEGSNYIKDRRKEEVGAPSKYWDKSGMEKFRNLEKALTRMDKGHIDKLKEIIEKKEIRILFQPIVNLREQNIVGYEALCRGPADSEMENPLVMFEAARLARLTWKLDEVVIEKILESARGLKKGLNLFINIDPDTLSKKPDILNKEFLYLSGVYPGNIVIEITEGGLARDFEKYFAYFKKFREMGIKISIDDTGSGYVSLRDVAKLKPDFIKLDISLVRGIDQDETKQNIFKTLMRFSEGIGATVSAEGIETEDELGFLLKSGVCFGQGYLFSRPGPPFPEIKKTK